MIVEEHADCNPEEVGDRRHATQDTRLRSADHQPRLARQFGKIEIPQETSIAVLTTEEWGMRAFASCPAGF